MHIALPPYVAASFDWLNANQGVVGVAIFVTTLVLGWITGIFDALRRKPRFRMQLIDGPTFCCTFIIGRQENGFDIHRSAFALYLHVSNVGSASGSINEVHLGYHWHIHPFSRQWLLYRLGWFWLRRQATIITDFQVYIGENLKLYPFLFQRSTISGDSAETFLQIGQSTNGVVYFEQSDSWGGCFPSVEDGSVRVKIRLVDAFGQRHSRTFKIPSVTLEEAKKYNPTFGDTLAHLRQEIPPVNEQSAAA